MSDVIRKVSERTGREYNDSNLVKITKETAYDNGKKGGVASGEARRKRKTLKDTLLLLLEEGDTQNNMTLALIEKALAGDVKAFEVVRDTIGEKPTEKQNLELKGNINTEVNKITIITPDEYKDKADN